MIVAAGLLAGCDTLLSEDMQHGFVVAGADDGGQSVRARLTRGNALPRRLSRPRSTDRPIRLRGGREARVLVRTRPIPRRRSCGVALAVRFGTMAVHGARRPVRSI